jgi:hypothetical protein
VVEVQNAEVDTKLLHSAVLNNWLILVSGSDRNNTICLSLLVSLTLFTLTSLHLYICQVSQPASQSSYTDWKAVQLDGDRLYRHLVHCSVCVPCFNSNNMRHSCAVGNLPYSRAVCVRSLACAPGALSVRSQHVTKALTRKLRICEPVFTWTIIVFGCTTHH